MDTMHFLVKYIIIIEVFLIIMLVIGTYVAKAYFIIHDNKNSRISVEIRDYLAVFESQGEGFVLKDFKKSWKKINLIVPAIHEIDKANKNMLWEHARKKFILNILLPLARKAAVKSDWIYRFYASESFSMMSQRTDEPIIAKLIQDTVPLVFYSSINAAIQNRFEKCLNEVITRMTTENWLTKAIFLQAFDNAPTTTRFMIERRLMSSADPLVRSTCYNILIRYPFGKVRWDYSSDLNGRNVNLKISTIKYIAHVEKKSALPLLIKYLKDPMWEVRTATLRCLSEIGSVEAIPEIIPCLEDPHWWVRFAAAQTLNNLGPVGRKALEAQGVILGPEVNRIAQHVMNRL